MRKYILFILLIAGLILVSCDETGQQKEGRQKESEVSSNSLGTETASPESVTAEAIEENKTEVLGDTIAQTPSVTAEPNLSGEAKSLYMQHMEKNKEEGVNAFSLVDIDQDGIPELLEGEIYYPDSENAQQQVSAIYGYINGKLKKLTKKDFWHERGMSYLPDQSAILLYDGGTSNSYTYYGIKKNKLKKQGTIGKLWYDSDCTIRKPNLNGKWISEKTYKNFLKKTVNLSLVENTKENRKLYFQNRMTIYVAVGDKFTIPQFQMTETGRRYTSSAPEVVSVNEKGSVSCLKEGEGQVSVNMDFPGRTENYNIDVQVAPNFNEDGICGLVEMKINKIHDFGKKFLLTGKTRIPANALPTQKEVKQLKKGKLDFRGKAYKVKKVFDEGTGLTTYYLYENSDKGEKSYDYELADITALMNYPNPAVYDKNGKPVYDSVGEVSVWIDQNAFIDMYAGSMGNYFFYLKSWQGRWTPMNVEKNCVTKIMTE